MLTLDILFVDNVCKDTKCFILVLSREQGGLLQIFPFFLFSSKTFLPKLCNRTPAAVSFPYPHFKWIPPISSSQIASLPSSFALSKNPKAFSREPQATLESRQISYKSLPLSFHFHIQFLCLISTSVAEHQLQLLILELHFIARWIL